MKLSLLKGDLILRIVFYARNLEKLPIPPVDETETGPAGWQTDSIVKVPEGPFELRNFVKQAKKSTLFNSRTTGFSWQIKILRVSGLFLSRLLYEDMLSRWISLTTESFKCCLQVEI